MHRPKLTIDILTLFPKMMEGPLGESMLKIAQKKGLVKIRVHDLRRWSRDRHRKCDDKPFGGGPGMVMLVEPIDRALRALRKSGPEARVVLLSPQGKPFDQQGAKRLARTKRLILLCGHYEGVDQRVIDHLVDEEVSVGDFVTTGGEFPALCVIDALVRLVPGVLGNQSSLHTESFHPALLDWPHYTRPREYRTWRVPEVLLTGDHAAIEKWRREQAFKATAKKRPDLLKKA